MYKIELINTLFTRIMCSRFIEDFANKVVEKSCCEACEQRKKLCKGPYDFNYINPSLCNMIGNLPYMISGENPNYLDLLLSCLHHQQYENFMSVLRAYYNNNNSRTMKDIGNKIKNHLDCITDTKLIISSSFGDWTILSYIYVGERTINHKISFKDWLTIYFKL